MGVAYRLEHLEEAQWRVPAIPHAAGAAKGRSIAERKKGVSRRRRARESTTVAQQTLLQSLDTRRASDLQATPLLAAGNDHAES